jgi:hypothetical protein
MADIVPANTQGYFRLSNVQGVRRGFVQKPHITDADAVQAEFDKLLDTATASAGEKDGLFASSGETMTAAFKSARSIHIAMVPSKFGYDWDGPGGREPDFKDRASPVVIVELDSMEAVDAHLTKGAEKFPTREIKGLKVYTVKTRGWKTQPEALCKLDDHTVIVADTDTAMERVLEQKAAGPAGSLGQTAAFQEAFGQFGDKGDLFAYTSFDAIRTDESEVPKMLSWLAGYADVGGEATVRIKAGSGTELPEFLTSGSKPKQLLGRIPAEAAYVVDGTFNNTPQTRDALAAWLKKELESPDGLGQMLPRNTRGDAMPAPGGGNQEMAPAAAIVQNLTKWLNELPIKTELAMFGGLDRNGKWVQAILADVEDRAKADAFVEKLKEMTKGVPVPLTWESKPVGANTIHYVDLAKIVPPGAVPDEVKKSLDFQVGYVVTGDLLAIGTVGAIEFALQPSGSTYADRIQWKGVDRENTLLLSLAPGAVVHHKFGVPQADDALGRIAKEIPREANYTASLNLGKHDATLRANVPLSSLIGWLTVEFNTDKGPAKLKELLPAPPKRTMPVETRAATEMTKPAPPTAPPPIVPPPLPQ